MSDPFSNAPALPNPSPLIRLMRLAAAGDASVENDPDPAIHRAIALHRESLLRHRLGLTAQTSGNPSDPAG